ncbi:unnamed protein product [Blepharisma stoltei]|uniref:S5 DRBM domain-containing protein n=1 Tax=Blepharisma stoltei TaxID=1481888 RepID=A0AAU9KAS6_9CILI|nr:unnamed protein product [Blepharisma stoltei]
MLRLSIRNFSKFTALSASHRFSLPKKKNPLGLQRKADYLHDPDRLAKLQKLAKDETSIPGMSLSESVKKLAKTDEEFNDFLKEFKSKEEPKWSSILKAERKAHVRDYEKTLLKTDEERIAELELHEEFRKKEYIKHIKEAVKSSNTLNEVREPGIGYDLKTLKNMKFEAPWKASAEKDFHVIFLDSSTSTNISALQRTNSRRTLLFMGNGAGMIAYGIGTATSYSDSFDKAVEVCRRNLINIPLDPWYTNPIYLKGKWHGTIFEIWPSQAGQSWGEPTYGNMLILAGLHNFEWKITGKNATEYSKTYAMFNALVRNTTPRELAEISGKKLYTISWGRPDRLHDLPVMSRG